LGWVFALYLRELPPKRGSFSLRERSAIFNAIPRIAKPPLTLSCKVLKNFARDLPRLVP
jgi:hypothetical protein